MNKRFLVFHVVLVSAMWSASSACAGEGFRVEKEELGADRNTFLMFNPSLDADGKTKYNTTLAPPPVFSKVGCHYAYIFAKGKWCVVMDGKRGPEFDRIGKHGPRSSSLRFSDNGEHLAYVAKKGDKWHVVLDGKPGPPFDTITQDPILSPDGGRVACSGTRGQERFVVVDGKLISRKDCVRVMAIGFSPDGKRFAFGAMTKKGGIVVVDGKPGPLVDSVGPLDFSPDSKRIAYGAMDVKEHKYYMIINGKRGKSYRNLAGGAFSFSPDSKRFAYIAKHADDKLLAVVDDKEGPVYDAILPGSQKFSADSKHYMYIALKDEKAFTVVDGKPGPLYDMVWDMCMSSDGKRLAYFAKKGEKSFAVIDGRESAPYESFGKGGILFSPDGKHVAYTAVKGENKWTVVMDDRPGPEYFGIQSEFPQFSPDSKQLVYVATKDGKSAFVVHGKGQGPVFDDIINWAARGFTAFTKNGTLQYMGVKNQTMFRVRHVPTKRR